MKFIVDEDLPSAVAELLRTAGFDAQHVRELGLSGKPDSVIMQTARDTGSILMTADMHFADARAHPAGSHPGIVLLRFPDHFRRQEILGIVERFLDTADLPSIEGHLVVVDPHAYRIRRQP